MRAKRLRLAVAMEAGECATALKSIPGQSTEQSVPPGSHEACVQSSCHGREHSPQKSFHMALHDPWPHAQVWQ